MSRFEYLSVLISIVIGLGISEVVRAWARLLQRRARVRFYWLHAFWSAVIALLLVQFWWGFWNFRAVESWSLGGLLAVVSEALTLVVASIALTPEAEGRAAEQQLDLRAYYYENTLLFFGASGLTIVQLIAVDNLVGGQPLLHEENLFRIPGVILCAVAASSGSERLHTALAGVGLVLVAGFLMTALMW